MISIQESIHDYKVLFEVMCLEGPITFLVVRFRQQTNWRFLIIMKMLGYFKIY